MTGFPAVSVADVVPPEAVTVVEGWLSLVDRGDFDTAIARYAQPDAAAALRRRLAKARRPHGPVRRSMRAWAGHGVGDTLRMEPGGYYAMIYDARDASGVAWTDEVRVRPDGHDGWRVVDAIVGPAEGPGI